MSRVELSLIANSMCIRSLFTTVRVCIVTSTIHSSINILTNENLERPILKSFVQNGIYDVNHDAPQSQTTEYHFQICSVATAGTMIGSHKNHPKNYFVFHFRILRFLGLGWWHLPQEGKTANFGGWYIYYSILTQVVWVAGFVGLETIDPFVGEKDMDRFMFSLSFVITHNLTLIKLYIFFFKNLDIQEITRTLEIELYDYYQNVDRNRRTVRLSKIITGSFIFFGWVTIANGNVYGAIQDFRWKALVANLNDTSLRPLRTLPQPIYIPWKYQNDISYIPTFILETVGLLWTGHIVMTIDTFIATVILHMGSQFETLNEAITTAYDRTMTELLEGISHNNNVQDGESFMSKEERNERIVHKFLTKTEIDAALQKTFRNCFKQHQVLINCVKKFSITYSYGFMTQLLSSMAAICVVMVQVSQDASGLLSIRLVTSLAFFFAMIIQLGMQCFTGNELTVQAERISDAVMQCKWESLAVPQRRQLLMMMLRAQRPLRLTAAGFTNMDNACFLAIMKAAYSYYAVLSQKSKYK